ncbi:cadherin EGF LAG seven-pass G-type receptor 3-like [Crotalus adamanteus]|uniref:Cadherin EGF LAG seven-pass G-type receptor 3-like n=1 Tax=Crotalus adamanteus TaxID=8729 RepID=A0AAW1BXS4_CROAD
MVLLLLFLAPSLNHKAGGITVAGMEANGEPGHSRAASAGETLSESELEKIGLRKQIPRGSLSTKIRKIRCSGSTAKSLLFRFLPILSWLPRYPVKEWLLGDITSGFSVGIMHLPQGLAYALLAGLPPVHGLYSAFYPVLLYFLFGTSRHISVGPFAVISGMLGSMTESLEPNGKYLEVIIGTNKTFVNEARRDAARVELVAAVTCLMGLFQVALGLLQFGFVATYLSEPLVRGYTTAAAVHVLVSQLKYVFAISLEEKSGPLSLIYTFVEICSKLPETHIGTLMTALISMVALLLIKLLNDKLDKKLPVPIPTELLTIIVSTAICYGASLNNKFGISVVGDIPKGLRSPEAPNGSWFGQVIGNAFAIAIVSYVLCISLGKIFALKYGYSVDSSQELIALGLSNVTGSFFHCYSISCSMSRSLIQESAGGHSQMASVISSLIILATILKIGELFHELPKAVLAAIVIVNLKGMFKQFKDIPALWRSNFTDLFIWLVTFIATVFLNLDLGLAAAVTFSLFTVIFRTQMPYYSILGQVSTTGIYKDIAEYHKAKEIPGVKIFHSSATIYFANAELYAEALKKKCGIDVCRLIEKKVKALKRKQKKDKKEAKKTAKKSGENNPGFEDVEMDAKSQEPEEGIVDIEINGTVMASDPPSHHQPQSCGKPSLNSLGLEKPSIHSIILDFSSVTFVDTVSIKTLKNIFKDFQEIQVDVFLAGCHGTVITQLERGNFFNETITKNHLFASVHDAITYITRNRKQSMPHIDNVEYSTNM